DRLGRGGALRAPLTLATPMAPGGADGPGDADGSWPPGSACPRLPAHAPARLAQLRLVRVAQAPRERVAQVFRAARNAGIMNSSRSARRTSAGAKPASSAVSVIRSRSARVQSNASAASHNSREVSV